jgi:hypothetical protein
MSLPASGVAWRGVAWRAGGGDLLYKLSLLSGEATPGRQGWVGRIGEGNVRGGKGSCGFYINAVGGVVISWLVLVIMLLPF